MNNTFDRATVEEVAISVGELRLEYPPHSPARDGVCKSKSQDEHYRR
jgi:hypothetical protein